MLKIFFHSECSFYAGSERILFLIINEVCNIPDVEVTFSYKKNTSYDIAARNNLNKKVKLKSIIKPFSESRDTRTRTYIFKAIIDRILFRLGLINEIFQFYKYLKQNKPDILHVNNGGFPGARSARAAAIAGKIAGVKQVIMVVNNLASPHNSFSRILDIPVDLVLFNCVHIFVTGSKRAQKQLKEISFGRAKLISIPNCSTDGVVNDEDMFNWLLNLKEEKLVMGVFGQLIARKGHKFLLEGLSLLKEEDWICLFVGSGELRPQLSQRVTELGLGESVILVENNDNYKNLMRLCDIIIQPSLENEDFPLTVVEALSLGKPVIGSDVGGISEQLNYGQAGIIVQPGNSHELCSQIRNLIENVELRRRLSTNAIEHFDKNYTRSKVLKQYFDLYKIKI